METNKLLVLLLVASACSGINSLAVSGTFCADAKPSITPPSSVHALRPGDISLVSALGLSTSQRSEESPVLHGLSEILSTFNPSVTTLWPKNDRSLLEQVDTLVSSLNNHQWKLLLFFVPVEELCVCSGQASAAVDSAVQRVEAALDKLHSQLDHSLVHVVVWEGKGHSAWKCSNEDTQTWPKLERTTLMTVLQESLSALLQKRQWWNTRRDFTVVLQSAPTHMDALSDLPEKATSDLVHQLWTKLLQPTRSEFEAEEELLCPSKERPYLYTHLNWPFQPNSPESPNAELLLSRNWGSDFTCTYLAPSDSVPTSVHRLRPGDINVVASLGDSITAGFGARATNIIQLLFEERGVSWSIGGDETLETVTTIPNILKKFNPNIFGFSEGRGSRPNGFNMAVSGAKAKDMPGQVRDLVEALRNNTNVNFEQDWKLVTLFIGGNDLCQYCRDQVSLSPKKYIEHIQNALDILYQEVPRVLVNFVEILQIEDLRKIKSNTTGCVILQPNLCPCFIQAEENSDQLYEMKRINRKLQTETERLVFGGRYNSREDFALVLQPFFQNSVVPMGTDKKPDLSFFSVDCFHFRERGHAEMAIALWNNMLEPVGNKQVYNNFTHDHLKLRCPSEENPFFFTRVNSQTPESTKPPTPVTEPDPVGPWLAVILAIAGFAIGSLVTWVVLYCRGRSQKKKRQEPTLMVVKGTGL